MPRLGRVFFFLLLIKLKLSAKSLTVIFRFPFFHTLMCLERWVYCPFALRVFHPPRTFLYRVMTQLSAALLCPWLRVFLALSSRRFGLLMKCAGLLHCSRMVMLPRCFFTLFLALVLYFSLRVTDLNVCLLSTPR